MRGEIIVKTVAADRRKENKLNQCLIRVGAGQQPGALMDHQYSATSNEKIAVNQERQ